MCFFEARATAVTLSIRLSVDYPLLSTWYTAIVQQCRERWCHHLDPRIVKGQWTAAEDELIVSMQKRIGNKWAQIAQVG